MLNFWEDSVRTVVILDAPTKGAQGVEAQLANGTLGRYGQAGHEQSAHCVCARSPL